MQIRVIRHCRVVDALADWGIHEAQGRLRQHYSAEGFFGEKAKLNGVEVAVTARAPMVRLILNSQPVGCLEIELTAGDVPHMLVFDGRAASAYAEELFAQQSESGEHVRALVNADSDVRGPLVCIARFENQTIQLPLTTFDGCHRLAAWIGQLKRRQPYPINGYLILTQRQIEFWR
jgi:hypothetical protein